jgi:predicted DNA-binding protein
MRGAWRIREDIMITVLAQAFPPVVPAIAEIGLTEIDGEPRARDIDIAERLGFERPRKIREIIERNIKEIEGFGPAPRHGAMVGVGSGAKREVEEFWLNEEQALLVSVLSRAPNAPAVRAMLIKVFVAWRRGNLASQGMDTDARKVIGGIVKSIVHKELAEAIGSILPAMIAKEIASGEFSIGKGVTAGQIIEMSGISGAKGIKGLAGFVSRRVAGFHRSRGIPMTEGRVGLRSATLFNPHLAREWLEDGGRAAIHLRASERAGQGVLPFKRTTLS